MDSLAYESLVVARFGEVAGGVEVSEGGLEIAAFCGEDASGVVGLGIVAGPLKELGGAVVVAGVEFPHGGVGVGLLAVGIVFEGCLDRAAELGGVLGIEAKCLAA